MIKITAGHIEIFDNKNVAQSAVKKSKKIPISFFNRIPQLPFEAVKATLENCSPKELKLISDNVYYGVPFLHLCVLNSNPQVLDFALKILKDNNIEATNIVTESEGTNKISLFVGETLMNVAYRQASIEKIKILCNYGLSEINTTLQLNVGTNRYTNINCASLLEVGCCNYYINNAKNLDFYISFALSVQSFQEAVQLRKKAQRDFSIFKPLLQYQELYKDAYFKKMLIDIIESTSGKINSHFSLTSANKIIEVDNIIQFAPELLKNEELFNTLNNLMDRIYNKEVKTNYQEKLNAAREKELLTALVDNKIKEKKIIKI